MSRSFREAPIFLGTFTFLVAVGAAIAVIPNLPLIRVLLVTQVINGLLLPIVLFAVLRLVNDRELMGAHVNSLLHNILAGDRNYRHDPFAGVYIDNGDKRISRSCGGIRAGVSSAFHEQNHSLFGRIRGCTTRRLSFWRFEFEPARCCKRDWAPPLHRPHRQ